MKKRSRPIILHPFLFALYPPLFFYVQNQDEVWLYHAVRPLLIALLVAVLLLVGLRLVIRSWQRAAMLTTVSLLLFFSYNQFRSLLRNTLIFGIDISRHRYMLALWLVLFAALVWWVIWRLKEPLPVTQIFNLVGAALVIFSLVQVYQYQVKTTQVTREKKDEQLKALGLQTITKDLTPPKTLPDIYYVILDGYSRSDVLQTEFGYDNSAFLNGLRQRGFMVASCARSNYPTTAFSLSSSLNMQYFHPLADQFFASGAHWKALGNFIRTNIVRDTLEELGYQTVAFDTAHSWANLNDADVFYSMKRDFNFNAFFLESMNQYERALLDTTLLNGLGPIRTWVLGSGPTHILANSLDSLTYNQMDSDQVYQYKMVSYTLDRFEQDVPKLAGPKFVFAHILSVHPPFVLGPDGSYQPDDTERGYTNSINDTDKRMLQIIDNILANSSTPPVIILQADHGRVVAKNEEAILNAYYLPGGGENQLTPSISPVNSFRVVFNRYFGAHLDLLADHHYRLTGEAGSYQLVPTADENCQP